MARRAKTPIEVTCGKILTVLAGRVNEWTTLRTVTEFLNLSHSTVRAALLLLEETARVEKQVDRTSATNPTPRAMFRITGLGLIDAARSPARQAC